MAYVKNPTEEQRKERRETINEQKRQMKQMITDLVNTWQENPETIAEMLQFGSRIYQYSIRNNMLVYAQNPHATYIQSFKAWKKMGVSVKKGEHGYKVYVPVKATILKIDGDLVPLEHATDEQKLMYQAGEIESITKKGFKPGYVYDISQTTYPKEEYPKLFQMGYASEVHGAIVEGLKNYARSALQCPVSTKDFKSISLRGGYVLGAHAIQLNALLEDTEKLSTLAHELGHAMIHQDGSIVKTTAQKELEADALGIMLQSYYGIEITDSRKRHLVYNYEKYHQEYQEAVQRQEKTDSFGQVLENVFELFKKEIPEINQFVGKQLQKHEAELAKQGIALSTSVMQKSTKPSAEPGKNEIYDRIKANIQIVDYAAMHGIELQRVGRYYTIKGHDSVRIDLDKNCFWRNSGIGKTTTGSVIDFAVAFVHDEDLHEALKELSALVGSDMVSAPKALSSQRTGNLPKKSLEENLPECSRNMHRVYAYLTQTRFLDPDVVQDFVDRKMLYQDTIGNCVFVAYGEDKKPVFANLRGTLSERRFLGDVAGCDYQQGFYINNEADKLIITESVIDAMSIMSILNGQGVDFKEYDYLPLNGTDKLHSIFLHLAEQPKEQVLLALDDDVAGVKHMQMIREQILDELSGLDLTKEQVTFHVPEAKDWNEELINSMKKLKPVSEIPFLEETDLPYIHTYAIQNTGQYVDQDFQPSRGKDRYRLVELNTQGEIVPVDVMKGNVFRSEEDIRNMIFARGLLPALHEEVTYNELLKLQEGMKLDGAHQETKQRETRTLGQDQDLGEPDLPLKGVLDIQKYEVKDGMITAVFLSEGAELQEAVLREQDRVYVSTGYVFDHTYQEYDLTEEQKAELEEYIAEKGIVLEPESSVMMLLEDLENEKSAQSGKSGSAFLDALQKQHFQTQEPEPAPELAIGLGE